MIRFDNRGVGVIYMASEIDALGRTAKSRVLNQGRFGGCGCVQIVVCVCFNRKTKRFNTRDQRFIDCLADTACNEEVNGSFGCRRKTDSKKHLLLQFRN
jgi:hypothetical protein